MNIDKSCYNSFCSRRLTERNAAILSSYNIYYTKVIRHLNLYDFHAVLLAIRIQVLE